MVASLAVDTVAYRGGFRAGFGSLHTWAIRLATRLTDLSTVSSSLLSNLSIKEVSKSPQLCNVISKAVLEPGLVQLTEPGSVVC